MRSAPGQAGTGPPVLLLTGVGLTSAVARRSIAALRKRFLVLEPRVGKPGEGDAISVPTPEHALALIDAAGADRAHVVGFSFGATIAQEIATRYPKRVRSLILGSSTAGGELYVPPAPAVLDFVRRLQALPAEEGLWATVPYLYAAGTCRRNAPLIGEDIALRLREPLDPAAYAEQLAAARVHDTVVRLSEIAAPTLVVHGAQDRILPIDNGRRLAAAITGARFMPLAGAAHAFPTDAPKANQAIVSFLVSHSPRARRSAPPRTGRATRA